MTISESKTEAHVHSDSTCTGNADIVFNAAGQQYRQTTSFTCLRDAVTETSNLSNEIDQRIHAGWVT